MIQPQHRQLMHTLRNSGRTNLSRWVKQIVDKFCEEQAIDERVSFDNIKSCFHDDFHESFIYTKPTLLFKFLIDKGVAHIVEPRPPLVEPRSNNDRERTSWWENSSRIKSGSSSLRNDPHHRPRISRVSNGGGILSHLVGMNA